MPESIGAGLSASDYTDVTADVSFGTARTPSTNEATHVIATVAIESTGGNEGRVDFDLDTGGGGRTVAQFGVQSTSGALTGAPDSRDKQSITVIVPSGTSYTLVNALDPAGTNAIVSVEEMSL